MKIILSQPYLFPWRGFIELVRHADLFVHVSDVQYSRHDRHNRYTIKTKNGPMWLTVPIKKTSLNTNINEIVIENSQNWKTKHLNLLKENYGKTKYFSQMMNMIEQVYSKNHDYLAPLSISSTNVLLSHLKIKPQIYTTADYNISINGKNSRILELCKYFGADEYITAMGALRYIDYKLMEDNKISVYFIKYDKLPYPQLHGKFDPYVSTIDLIANCGPDSSAFLTSNLIHWREFVASSEAKEYMHLS